MIRAQLANNTTLQSGRDFGLFVLCRKPLDAKEDVTTIALCGLSGWSTSEVADDLSQGLLFLHRKKIEYGQPLWRILACPWRRDGRIIRPIASGRRWIDPSDLTALKRLASDSMGQPRIPKRPRAGASEV